KKGKPVLRSDGTRESTVVAGIVIESTELTQCVVVTTGVKAQPANQLEHRVHDSHAEILAIRAFNLYLFLNPERADIIKSAKVHLYVSEMPCGDASMSLVASRSASSEEWLAPDSLGKDSIARGRANFSRLGIVRTKPGRPDSPVSHSKSCSDKLARYQFISLTRSFVSPVCDPIYFYSLIVPKNQIWETDVHRCWTERL
ncbi:hypothetical protein CANCADRAFT_11544, partial [Tortispora caseinolytica NRRL Y-17796]